MRVKLRRIGNSKGVILPNWVTWLLANDNDWTDQPDGSFARPDREVLLEMTVIGQTVVLSGNSPDELELSAALAFAEVKRKRKALMRRLAEADRKALGSRIGYYGYYEKFGTYDEGRRPNDD